MMKEFVDEHRDLHGVEPICKVLQIAPSGYRRHASHQRDPALRCARAQRDEGLIPQIERVWQVNMQVYGADKVWKQLNREGIRVARCTVERLMKRLHLQGVRRGKVVRTTISDKAAPCPLDRVNRQFKADRPNQLWVSDFTYVSTWQGWVYVAFVIDVFARRIVGWRVSRSMRSDFVLDALEQALFDRQPERSEALVHHSDRGLHPVHRTARRGRYRTLCGQSWRQLRQRLGRDHQRAVQGRIDPPPGTLEDHRIGGTGHAGMGVLVQSPPSAGGHRIYSACRSRGKILSATRRGNHFGGVNLNQPASTKPGAIQFISRCALRAR